MCSIWTYICLIYTYIKYLYAAKLCWQAIWNAMSNKDEKHNNLPVCYQIWPTNSIWHIKFLCWNANVSFDISIDWFKQTYLYVLKREPYIVWQLIHFKYLFVCFSSHSRIFHSSHMKTLQLPVKGCKIWHMLGTYGRNSFEIVCFSGSPDLKMYVAC